MIREVFNTPLGQDSGFGHGMVSGMQLYWLGEVYWLYVAVRVPAGYAVAGGYDCGCRGLMGGV